MPKFIVERRDDSFVDAYGVRIHYSIWSPGKPRGVVQLLHGLGEYAARYELLAQDLVSAGYAVYADDHRGHGRTGVEQWADDPSKLGRLGPGGLRATIDAIVQFRGIIDERHPELPVVLLGHSWGSLMAQIIFDRRRADYAGVVLTGTAYRMPWTMNPGDLNKRHRTLGGTGHEWLSRDPEVAKAFQADPLTFNATAAKLFGVRDGLRLYGRPRRGLPDVPMLIMIGSDDSLGGIRSAHRLAEQYRRRGGLTDVEVVVFEEARHEIFNELNQAEVRARLVEWLREKVPQEPARRIG
ncbi:alpha/beta fold hydrolase [Ruicaihuangia caeni]|uniref:Alpha/beta fold hydrolase n=1 Tax=Ruicaihuangia caeni TaxID=3042517 RepID=A0AAW6T796_9MICO|nr:alpha/beta fold hydrolase [Klugiella sp. YN-L-19]MDI2098971.1 alpha/beta fold hydrolase [Klugiella sp. YN-L-19]